jgi:hypothetical protein
MEAAEREAAPEASQFDRLKLKNRIWNRFRAGEVKLACYKLGTLARVLCFLPPGVRPPPLEFWGRIFAWFGPSPDGRPWRVTWFASPATREFPEEGQDLGPEHVNGGYTMGCSADGIFIYRAEEATRVLVHEMMHAACLDQHGWDVPHKEALVETWAELVLIALRSRGGRPAAAKLWALQAQWIVDTNWKARHLHGTHDLSDYAWRYLCGREMMYQKLGVELPAPNKARSVKGRSLRFTHPALDV